MRECYLAAHVANTWKGHNKILNDMNIITQYAGRCVRVCVCLFIVSSKERIVATNSEFDFGI